MNREDLIICHADLETLAVLARWMCGESVISQNSQEQSGEKEDFA